MATVGGIDIGQSVLDEPAERVIDAPGAIVTGGIDVGGSKIDEDDGPLGDVGRFVRGMNVGFARGAGRVVDFINPFDEQTGSAVEGLKTVFETISPGSTQNIGDDLLTEFAVGAGEGIAAFAPVVKGLQLLKGTGGAVGAFADDALVFMQTRLGLGAEAIGGGGGRAAETAAEEAGAGPILSTLAGMAGGGILAPLTIAAPSAALGVARQLPGAAFVGRQARDLQASLLPMTAGGAREVAATRLRGLAGGEERAAELAGRIDPRDPLGLTPAQQTGDPNLLGLERAAAREDPLVRERILARGETSRAAAVGEVRALGGDVGEARSFFRERLATFRKDMETKVDDALEVGEGAVTKAEPGVPEAAASAQMVERVRVELDTALGQERALWAAVPQDVPVSTATTQSVVAGFIEDVPFAQRGDIPADLETMFSANGPLRGEASVRELHGLYSEMRRVSRNAMSGETRNANQARIANGVAEAVLEDLGAVAGDTAVGKAINQARAFSRSLHETFDQGATGRILRRTAQTAAAIDPEVAAARTVGRGGVAGQVAAEKITAAAPEAGQDIAQFLRGRFSDAVTSPTGEFTPKQAARFLRANRETLADFPDLDKELRRALSSRNAAASFGARNQARQKLVDAQSTPARFNLGPEQKAVLSIIGADDPARAATTIVNAAKKDPTGRALAGVKAAFTDHLVSGENISGKQMQALLNDKAMKGAMSKIFNAGELKRMDTIATALTRMNPTEVTAVSDVIDASSNKLLEMVVRIAAAREGGKRGGGTLGGSMQTANIFVERARTILRNLTNVRARALLTQAVEDPALFRDLLATPKSVTLPAAARSRLAPFLTGAAAGLDEDQQQETRQ